MTLRLALIADGTFMPSHEGATRRFIGLARALASWGADITVFHAYRGWTDANAIKNEAFRTYLLPPAHHYDDIRVLQALITKHNVDVLVISEYVAVIRIASLLKDVMPNLHIVLELHDIASDYLETIGAPAGEVTTARRAEQIAFEIADRLVAFNEHDCERAASLVKAYALLPVGSSIRNERSRLRVSRGQGAIVLPFGVEDRAIMQCAPVSDLKVILFLGNHFHEPNARAVEMLFKEVYLPVITRRTDAVIWIVGGAPQEMIDRFSTPQFRFIGQVASLDGVLNAASLAVAPTFSGSGVKTKVLDYTMAGLPVLCTSLALRGIANSTDDLAGFVVEDQPDRYGPIICRLLDDPEPLAAIALRGREVAEKQAWSVIAPDTVDAYKLVAREQMDPWDRNLSEIALDFARRHSLEPYYLKDNQRKRRFANSAFTLDQVYCCGWGRIEVDRSLDEYFR